MAVENDYNLLVTNLTFLADNAGQIRDDVRSRLLQEKAEGLEPNETHLGEPARLADADDPGHATQLDQGVQDVLRSRPGEWAFDAQPPPPPDALP